MKTTLFICLLFINFFSFSQEIVKEGKAWNVMFTVDPSPIPIYEHSTSVEYLQGDTIIEGKTYKILHRSEKEDKSNSEIVGFLREEGKKVYARNTSSPEGLLYDFSVEVGDTIILQNYIGLGGDTLCFVASSIREGFVGGQTRKVFRFSLIRDGVNMEGVDTWCSEIGSTCGIINMGDMTRSYSAGYYLLCAYDNNELIYKNHIYNNCYLGIDDFPQEKYKQEITVLPNPAKNYIKVSIHEAKSERYSLKLYDGMGKLVLQHELEPETTEISVKHLSQGVYFYCVYDKKGNYIESGKMVKIK